MSWINIILKVFSSKQLSQTDGRLKDDLGKETTDLIKRISIRGRFAFGVKCIERYILENQIKGSVLNDFLTILKEFTESDHLDVWDEKIREYEPHIVLGSTSYLQGKNPQIKTIYDSFDEDFIRLISEVISIGTDNLYSGTGEFSESTYRSTIVVTQLAYSILKESLSIESFEFSSFSESHGWGNKFRIDDINLMANKKAMSNNISG